MDANLRTAVEKVVDDLVAGRFDALAQSGRLSSAELEWAVKRYGATIVPIPEQGWDLVEVYRENDEPEFLLDVPIWTQEEGRSDLTLSMAATKVDQGYKLEIDDLHVL